MLPDKVLALLEKLSQIVDDLFKNQIDRKKGVYQTKVKNSASLRPYHVTVEVDVQQKEIPYSEFYKKECSQALKIVEEIIKILEEKEVFGKHNDWWIGYFKAIEKGFRENKWKKVEEYFLTLPEDAEYLLSFGPIERYHDKVYGVKRFFSFWFFQRDNRYSFYENLWKDLVKGDLEERLCIYSLSANKKRSMLFLGNTILQTGEVRALNATGWSRPEDPKLAERIKSIKMVSVDRLKKKVDNLNKSVLSFAQKRFKEKKFLDLINKYNRKYDLLSVVVHEFAHTVLKHPTSITRLGRYYSFIEEARAEAMQLLLNYELEKKGVLQKDSFLALILLYVFGFKAQKEEYEKISSRFPYFYFTVYLIDNLYRYKILKFSSNSVSFDKKRFEKHIYEILLKLVFLYNSVNHFASGRDKEIESFKEYIEDKIKFFSLKLGLAA